MVLSPQCFVYLDILVFIYLLRYLNASSSLDAGPSHPFEELEVLLPSALLEELFGIILLIGRLKDLPANIQSAFAMQNPGKVLIILVSLHSYYQQRYLNHVDT